MFENTDNIDSQVFNRNNTGFSFTEDVSFADIQAIQSNLPRTNDCLPRLDIINGDGSIVAGEDTGDSPPLNAPPSDSGIAQDDPSKRLETVAELLARNGINLSADQIRQIQGVVDGFLSLNGADYQAAFRQLRVTENGLDPQVLAGLRAVMADSGWEIRDESGVTTNPDGSTTERRQLVFHNSSWGGARYSQLDGPVSSSSSVSLVREVNGQLVTVPADPETIRYHARNIRPMLRSIPIGTRN